MAFVGLSMHLACFHTAAFQCLQRDVKACLGGIGNTCLRAAHMSGLRQELPPFICSYAAITSPHAKAATRQNSLDLGYLSPYVSHRSSLSASNIYPDEALLQRYCPRHAQRQNLV